MLDAGECSSGKASSFVAFCFVVILLCVNSFVVGLDVSVVSWGVL